MGCGGMFAGGRKGVLTLRKCFWDFDLFFEFMHLHFFFP